MKLLTIGLQILFLYVFVFIGNTIVSFTHLPIPGSIIGMLLLFICFRFKMIPIQWVESGSNLLIKELLLFFIPSAVAIIRYRDILMTNGTGILAILILSTLMVIVFTGIFAEKMGGRKEA